MKSLVRSLAVGAAISFAAAAHAQKQPSADLTPSYTTGETATYAFESVRKEKSTVSQFAAERIRTITHKATYEMRVEEASESGTTIALTLADASIKVEDASKTEEFDSRKPADDSDRRNQLLQAVKPAIGATVRFKFDPKGNILSCESDAELVKNSPNTLFAEMLMNETWVRMRWAPVFFPRTETGEVPIGESWPMIQNVHIPQMGKFDCASAAKLENADKSTANVAWSGECEFVPGKESEKSPATYKTFDIKGTLTFDLAKKHTRTMSANEVVDVDLNAGGIAISRSTDTQVKIHRTK